MKYHILLSSPSSKQRLPGFKVKIGKPSVLLQQIERNITNSTNCSPEQKSTEDEDKGIAEILMLQQRTVLQVINYDSNKSNINQNYKF